MASDVKHPTLTVREHIVIMDALNAAADAQKERRNDASVPASTRREAHLKEAEIREIVKKIS